MASRTSVASLTLAMILTGMSPVGAQGRGGFQGDSNILVGYVANAPQQLVGLGVAVWLPGTGGWGLYLDGKSSLDSPKNDVFDPNLTSAQAVALGDSRFSDQSDWLTMNLAVVRGVTEELALYAGAGMSRRTAYDQFVDPTGDRGVLGRYWVEDDALSGVHPNFLFGGFFRMSNWVAFQFGAETAPAGFSAGLHLRVR